MNDISSDNFLIRKGRETTEDFLSHHGVLGMHWGIRKDGKPQGWQGDGSGKSNNSSKASTKYDAKIKKLNEKYKGKEGSASKLEKASAKQGDKFRKEVWKGIHRELNKTPEGKAYKKMLGRKGLTPMSVRPSGGRSFTYNAGDIRVIRMMSGKKTFKPEEQKIIGDYFIKKAELVSRETKSNQLFKDLQKNEINLENIDKVETLRQLLDKEAMHRDQNDDYLMHTGSEMVEEFLAHHGVLGMKWGIRKDGKPQGWQGGSSGPKKKFKEVGTSNKKLIAATEQTDKYDDDLHKKLEEIELKSVEAEDRGEPLSDKDYAREWTNAYLDYHDKSIKAYEKINDDELNKEDKKFKEAMLEYHRESRDYWKNDYNKNLDRDDNKVKTAWKKIRQEIPDDDPTKNNSFRGVYGMNWGPSNAAPKNNRWGVKSKKLHDTLNELDSAQSEASRKTLELNNKYEGKLRTPEQRKAYMNERDKITKEHYDKAISELKSISDIKLTRNDRKVKDNLIKGLEREKQYELTWDSSWNQYEIEWPDLMLHSVDAGSEFLAHHGVLGMKWGIRKDGKPQGWQGSVGNAAKKVGKATIKVAKGTGKTIVKGRAKVKEIQAKRNEKKRLEEARNNELNLEDKRRKVEASYKIASTTRSARALSRNMGVLTDAELNKRIERLKKENEVREMAAKERERGRSWVSRALENSAKQSFSNVTTYGMTKLGKQAIDGLLDSAISGSGGKDSNGSTNKSSGSNASSAKKDSSSKSSGSKSKSSIDVTYNSKAYKRPSGRVKSNNRSYKSYGVSAISQFKNNNKAYGTSQSAERKSFSFGDVAYEDLFED